MSKQDVKKQASEFAKHKEIELKRENKTFDYVLRTNMRNKKITVDKYSMDQQVYNNTTIKE